MRHRKKLNSLSRKSAHRRAMLANMACSLILNKRITTTLAKAKALRIYVEPLITKSKNDTTHSRRVIFSYLKDKYAVTELFRDIAQKIADRPGGYTRILKTGNRLGDNAEMCFIELVDYNETYSETKTETKAKTRRSRRGGGSKAVETVSDKVADTAEKETLEKEEKKPADLEIEPDIKEDKEEVTEKTEQEESVVEPEETPDSKPEIKDKEETTE